jgi:hypothetical protein
MVQRCRTNVKSIEPVESTKDTFDDRLINSVAHRIHLIEHQLIIESIEWTDQGMYQCFLTNDVGEDTRSTWLKIKSNSIQSIEHMTMHD